MPANNLESAQVVAISNPRSGKNKRGGFEAFEKALKKYSQIKHVVINQEHSLLDALDMCQQQHAKILIINGGDGTLLHVLTYLKKVENQSYTPCLVLLRAGTTSMSYGDVGCKGRLNDVIEKVAMYSQGRINCLNKTPAPVLEMTLPDEGVTVCGMFFGAGAIYNGILYCRQKIHTKGVRGEVGPTVAMIRYIFDWLTSNKMTTSTRASVSIEHAPELTGDFAIITATTLNRLLMGVYPYWGQGKSDNKLSLTLIKKNAPKATKAFMRILRGKNPEVETDEDYYRSLCPTKTTLILDDGFTLDGELFGVSGKSTKVELQSAGSVTFLTT
ncbi:MAG: diacylglycerol kinase family protein [Gammaproteobacteria bacterium]